MPESNSSSSEPLVRVEDLKVYFPVLGGVFRRKVGEVKAVDGVSFQVKKGETVGLVGESGSGKTTIGRAIIRLTEPTAGAIFYGDAEISRLDAAAFRAYRKKIQIIFQDPYNSLNPRLSIFEIIGEALEIHFPAMTRGDRRERVAELLGKVGLKRDHLDRYPHEFSGGQRQRVGIARALAVNPEFIVCDEPVSALDVSVQAQVLNLLQDLQDEFGLSYVLISHDLAVVDYLCDEVAVMYLGRIVEQGRPEDLFANCAHPYTRALLEAVPRAQARQARRRRGAQAIASQSTGAAGCPYVSRCPLADQRCREAAPGLRKVGESHLAACHQAEAVMALPPLMAEQG